MQLRHIEHPEDTILTGDLSAINWFTLQGKVSLKMKSGRTYYKGKNVSDIKYYEQPHELEAFKMQEELYRQYNRDICRSSKGKNNFKRLPEFTL